MEKPEPKKMVRTILPAKNKDTEIPIEELLSGTKKITNKAWAEHWVNIVLMSKLWKAFIKMVKQR